MHHPARCVSTIVITAMIGFICSMLSGCASAPPITEVRLASGSYDDVFDQTLVAIRDLGYRLDRVDRRHGIITTQPLDAGSVLEPWRDPHTTPSQAIESTFNYERRIIRISFLPASGLPDLTLGTDSTSIGGDDLPVVTAQVARPDSDPFEVSGYDGMLRIDVQCILERSHRPGRRVDTASTRKVSYTTDPALLERGIPSQYWEPVSRDPRTEQYVMNLISRHAPGLVQIEQLSTGSEPGDS